MEIYCELRNILKVVYCFIVSFLLYKFIHIFESEVYAEMNCRKIAEFFFTYETPKMIEITNYKIGAVHRILQIIIAVYVFW